MLHTLRAIIFVGALLIALLGIIIMLIVNDGGRPHQLIQLTLILNFGFGLLLVFFMIKNKGIH